MGEQSSNKFKAKILRKAFCKYALNMQEKLAEEYLLIILGLSNLKKKDESYVCYIRKAERLSAEEKTILFYGVPIRLSKLQFAFLYIVLSENGFSEEYYNELSLRGKNKNSKGSFKTFISRFHAKCLKSIKDYSRNNKCHFSQMNDTQINEHINMLLKYKINNLDKYIATSEFKFENVFLQQSSPKKQKTQM